MSKSEYELISHNNTNFHLFLVNLLYRTPHIHKDYEISLVLDGTVQVTTSEDTSTCLTGDIFLMNPFFSHELQANEPALILSLQISAVFFATYYPQIEQTEFDQLIISHKSETTLIRRLLIELAFVYFQKEAYASIKCARIINDLFLELLQTQPHHLIPDKEKQASHSKGKRLRHIMHYIDSHYTEKLLLSDIAAQEELDLYYLSHFFKEVFGTTFQNYVTKIRCEHARQLLLLTDYSLLDISLSCGFSDPKYFNKGFMKQYGCSPKEYRISFQNARFEQQKKSMLTTQEFLSEQSTLITLEQYRQQ